MEERKTIFDPHRHGWPFANIYPFRLGIGRIRIPRSIALGFCGGMVFSALDRFYDREAMPALDRAPIQGEALFDALFRRQRQTLNGGVMFRTWRWQMKSDAELAALTTDEWTAVQRSIDAGHPIVICLIRVAGAFGKVWENHQVVVCGYRRDPVSGRVTLRVYDPNWRNRNGVRIDFTPGNRLNGQQYAPDGTERERMRGFFVIPYDRPNPALPSD
jgi:hypothetical protein